MENGGDMKFRGEGRVFPIVSIINIGNLLGQSFIDYSFCFRNFSFYRSFCCCLVTWSCLTLVTPWIVVCQALSPWDFSGKNTEVGCHFLSQLVLQPQSINIIRKKQVIFSVFVTSFLLQLKFLKKYCLLFQFPIIFPSKC